MENVTHVTRRKELIGTVTSDKMQHTVTVLVTSFKVHPLYHKRYRSTKKYHSDTGDVLPKMGDMVRIQSSRPLSKLKRWIVTEIMSTGASNFKVKDSGVKKKLTKTKAKSATKAKIAK